MKEIHLLCNAHLDPVWQWQRAEGVAEAISTFRVAADFCEEFDGFVFNHNESLLYEWIEEYEPALFERIKKLVKDGKWRIMGGWYLQPDCLIPSGESIIRQIETGRNYFKNKFGVVPETAINFDPFGHSRGMVQILKKCGYTSYIFMRPNGFVKEHDFVWKGYDDSKIYGHCIDGGYNTHLHEVPKRLDEFLKQAHEGANLMLWGIGNHGGGPSRCDLIDIEEYIKAHPEIKIVHSWCENYFDKSNKNNLRIIDESIVHCMVGCYTSMVRIKQLHRRLENELLLCEKMLAISGVEYDNKLMQQAEKALLFSEFHDILPGSMVKKSEDEAIRLLNHGSEILAQLCLKSFFKLCDGQKRSKDGEIPVFVFNPHPYEIEQEIELEFQLQDQNWNTDYITSVKVRTEDNLYLPVQNEKEGSTIPLDWRKRVCFRAKLKPMTITRFDLEVIKVDSSKRGIEPCVQNDTHFIFKNENMHLLINKNTGLIDKYSVNGIDYLNPSSCEIAAYADNEDPWGMTVDGFYDKIGAFKILPAEEANKFNGYPGLDNENVRIIENGPVRTKIQAVMKHSNSYAVIEYTIPKYDSYVDIKIKTLANDANVLYKLGFNTTLDGADFVGQQMFGKEDMLKNEKEVTFQKWCGLFKDDNGFVVLNRGTHGGSCKDGRINLTMMRTPLYCAHPIPDRILTKGDRNFDHIDIGEREFEYRIMANDGMIEMAAEVYNQQPFSMYFFPSGDGSIVNNDTVISNPDILMTRYYMNEEGNIIVRLFNTKDSDNVTNFKINGNNHSIHFTKYEVKTFVVNDKSIIETNMLN